MKAETRHEAMTRLESQMEALLKSISEVAHDYPAPGSEELNWSHVGSLAHVVEQLQEIENFIGKL